MPENVQEHPLDFPPDVNDEEILTPHDDLNSITEIHDEALQAYREQRRQHEKTFAEELANPAMPSWSP